MIWNAGVAYSFNTFKFDPATLQERPGTESQSKAAVAVFRLQLQLGLSNTS